MNQNVELLNYIYQNSQMGVLTISKLLEIVTEGDFKNQISSQLNEYNMIHKPQKICLIKMDTTKKA